MEPMVFKDETVIPDDELVFSKIGPLKDCWLGLHKELASRQPGISFEWRYYNDGKSWLYRGLKKGKVVFWVGVMQDGFGVTFYLGTKAEALVAASKLPHDIKLGYEKTKGEKFRSISINVTSATDVDNILELVTIKLKAK